MPIYETKSSLVMLCVLASRVPLLGLALCIFFKRKKTKATTSHLPSP